MQTPNPLRSIGFAQERLHTGLIAFLVDLHRNGTRELLHDFLAEFGVPLFDDDDVQYAFERWKADLVLEIRGTTAHRFVAFEFKVDSTEGNFLHNDPACKQTAMIAARGEAEKGDVRHYYYVTLGAGEFAGPPSDERFIWVRLDAFRSAVGFVTKANPILSDWDTLLDEEQQRRRLAPVFAAAGKLDIWHEDVRSAGYRKAGVCLAVYGALIAAWRNAGYEQEFGKLRAYVSGRGPDPILNVADLWHSYRDLDLYFEVNQNGTLNFKVGNWSGGSLDNQTWQLIVAAIQGPTTTPAAINLRREPRPDTQTNTVCSWDVGLWKGATSPEEVVGRLAGILRSTVPSLRALR